MLWDAAINTEQIAKELLYCEYDTYMQKGEKKRKKKKKT